MKSPIPPRICFSRLLGHAPGHTGYDFSSKGERILFWCRIIKQENLWSALQFVQPWSLSCF